MKTSHGGTTETLFPITFGSSSPIQRGALIRQRTDGSGSQYALLDTDHQKIADFESPSPFQIEPQAGVIFEGTRMSLDLGGVLSQVFLYIVADGTEAMVVVQPLGSSTGQQSVLASSRSILLGCTISKKPNIYHLAIPGNELLSACHRLVRTGENRIDILDTEDLPLATAAGQELSEHGLSLVYADLVGRGERLLMVFDSSEPRMVGITPNGSGVGDPSAVVFGGESDGGGGGGGGA